MAMRHVRQLGGRLTSGVEEFGQFVRFAGTTGRWLVRGVPRWCRWNLLMPQFYHVGTRSAPMVMLLGAFIGMVLAVEMYYQFRLYGQEVQLGGVIAVSVVRHIGPVLAAVMLAGRVGTAVSAELGTMRVTEQIDAMRAMGTDPVAYLVVPRVVACVLMIPMLTVFSDLMGVLGGYVVGVHGWGINETAYWQRTASFATSYDVLTGVFKSIVFGLAIGVISCYTGFHCEPGARGVGRAATSSFVKTFLTIIVTNFFLAKFFQDLWQVIYGPLG